jgi:hypothetical protein
MSETPIKGKQEENSFSRRARLEDFLDETDEKPSKNKYYNNHSQNDNISKNQQEFGHKKRIKP